MPDTFVKIASVTVGSGGASSISFSSIPNTYTDLVIKLSARSNRGDARDWATISFNGSSANQTSKRLSGDGANATSDSRTDIILGLAGGNATASTFGNDEFYIPNYAGSSNKSISGDGVGENNATTASIDLTAGLWSQTAAITSITISSLTSSNWVQYSTATLYGIKSS